MRKNHERREQKLGMGLSSVPGRSKCVSGGRRLETGEETGISS